nr:MAG TPA: cytochrome C-like protein [Caudoviricetes sp.]
MLSVVNTHCFGFRLCLLSIRVGLFDFCLECHNANHGCQEGATQYEIDNFTELHLYNILLFDTY